MYQINTNDTVEDDIADGDEDIVQIDQILKGESGMAPEELGKMMNANVHVIQDYQRAFAQAAEFRRIQVGNIHKILNNKQTVKQKNRLEFRKQIKEKYG